MAIVSVVRWAGHQACMAVARNAYIYIYIYVSKYHGRIIGRIWHELSFSPVYD
jgi:hypothetical protein